MIRVGLLDRIFNRILNFFFGQSGETRAEEIEEREEREDVSEDIIFQRKIIKPTASERRGSKAVELFAFTFEDNFTDRFEELAREIQRYANDNNLFIVEDINELLSGYDDQESTTNPPFIFDEDDPEGTIEVGEE